METSGKIKNDNMSDQDFYKFQFVASLWTASAVLYFCIALPYSFLSDGLVDINL